MLYPQHGEQTPHSVVKDDGEIKMTTVGPWFVFGIPALSRIKCVNVTLYFDFYSDLLSSFTKTNCRNVG